MAARKRRKQSVVGGQAYCRSGAADRRSHATHKYIPPCLTPFEQRRIQGQSFSLGNGSAGGAEQHGRDKNEPRRPTYWRDPPLVRSLLARLPSPGERRPTPLRNRGTVGLGGRVGGSQGSGQRAGIARSCFFVFI